jgi:hypothetical protein
MIRMIGLLSILMLHLTALALSAQDINNRYMHVQQIEDYTENKPQNDKDKYLFAWHHYILGKSYQILSECCSALSNDAMPIYNSYHKYGDGANYIDALAYLSLNKYNQAASICKSYHDYTDTSPEFAGLVNSLGMLARNLQMENKEMSLDDFVPKSLMDSLELAYQLSLFSNCEINYDFEYFNRQKLGRISFAPLLLRLKLQQMICKLDYNGLEKMLVKINKNGIPFWEVAYSDDNVTQFSDPAILNQLAQAHLLIAQKRYQELLPNSSMGIVNYFCKKDLVDLFFEERDYSAIEGLLESPPDTVAFLPYQGWLAAVTGNESKAEKIWAKCKKIDDVNMHVSLIRVWNDLNGYEKRLDSLISLLSGNLQQGLANKKSFMNHNFKIKLWKINKEIGLYYLRQCVEGSSEQQKCDSARIYFQNSNIYAEVSLAFYDSDYCTGYYSAMSLSGRTDLMHEAHIGWSDHLAKIMPVYKMVIEPLQIIILNTYKEGLTK